MSFRQYGGINYAARNNIVKNNYTNATNLSVMNKVGQTGSIITFDSDIAFEYTDAPTYGIRFSDGTFQNTATTSTSEYWALYTSTPPPTISTIYYTGRVLVGANPAVTIGTISSDIRLAVSGGTAMHGNLYVANGDTSNAGIIYVTDNTNITNSKATLKIIADRTTGANYIESGKNNVTGSVADLSFTGMNATGTVWMTIKDDGKVGIGTTSPVQKLHVSGNMYVNPSDPTNKDKSFKIQLGTTSNCLIYQGTTDTSETIIQNNGGGALRLITANIGGIYIQGFSGNVGIGTTAPTEKLHVNGTLLVTGNATLNGTNSINGYALLASPTFTGIPAAPTASVGTNNTQIATTAFVQSCITTQYGLGTNILLSQGTTFTTNTNIVTTLASQSLTAGTWSITYAFGFNFISPAVGQYSQCGISDSSMLKFSGKYSVATQTIWANTNTAGVLAIQNGSTTLILDTTTTINFLGLVSYSGGSNLGGLTSVGMSFTRIG